MRFLALEEFHDARLQAIDSDSGDRTLKLTIAPEGGINRILVLHGCQLFRVTDFIAQNVISRMIVVQGPDIDREDAANRIRWASSLTDASSSMDHDAVQKLVEAVSRSLLCILYLEPSWGAELVAIGARIEEYPAPSLEQ